MADAYVDFFFGLDTSGAQCYGAANQPHRAEAAVGANAANATIIDLAGGTNYCQIKPTAGNVFACILATGSAEAARTAARIRIDEGEKYSLKATSGTGMSLYLWAV